jgi:holliday junction DNA helicase RuvA
MIGRLTGTLLQKTPPQLLVDVNGVGYEVDVPMSTFYDLPAAGERVSLLTHQVVREDAHLLYGFLTEGERTAFRELIRIAGVGPRTALAVLSGMSVSDLTQAVTVQESGRLLKVPGIGKKTAERLLLELKGKLGADIDGIGAGRQPRVDHAADVLRALLALGYSDREAGAAARQLPADVTVSDGIKQALKLLARN